MNNGGTYYCLNMFPKYGERISESFFEKLMEKEAHFEDNGIKILVSEESFCCVVIMPLMLRAHSMNFSSEIVFVDTSGSCDQIAFCCY